MNLFAAPHRLLFLIGVSQLMLSILWWSLTLAAVYPAGAMVDAIPVILLHAPMLLYIGLPPLFFGFLLTVFPRWMGYPDMKPGAYAPAGGGYAIAALMSWTALLTGYGALLVSAFLGALLASLWGLAMLLQVALRERHDGKGPTWHAWSILAAFCVAIAGQVVLLHFLFSHDAASWFFANRIGLHLFLMPVFLTVCHRMIPFFAANAVQNYRPWRPFWALGGLWIGMILLASGELAAVPVLHGGGAALLAMLTGLMLWKWWPRGKAPGLLWVLVVGFAWVPVGYALVLLDNTAIELGRAPDHALTIGFAGSLIVAMVTRVTQGHSGRPLLLPVTGIIAFSGVQLAALTRIGAAVFEEQPEILVVSSAIMALALIPWTARNVLIYLRARLDGRAG
ncbi:NnrS family protein [Sphingobium sp. DEHP117]|uniref:NnrS family protein n=1 Tax=Sphingobium sp. DEHP117 TaxID=2993436 RepID=UPI0027D65C0C|nr:NnrS family protein [Sphingobium sp. DEHP117]MDQ4419848.1 NnrS family protein [Sphingobium sp. DEHP117]